MEQLLSFFRSRRKKASLTGLILSSVLFLLLLDLVFSLTLHLFNVNHETNFPLTSNRTGIEKIFYLSYLFLKVGILGPIMETAIFQFLAFEIIKRLKLDARYFVLLSALLFGLSHYTDIYTIIITFLIGIVFNIIYIDVYQNISGKNAFISVWLIHSLYNTVLFIINFVVLIY